jgi:hypothetical protein
VGGGPEELPPEMTIDWATSELYPEVMKGQA